MRSSYRTRICLVTDIEDYSSRTVPQHADAQRRLRGIMAAACRYAGIGRVGSRSRQDRGDGRLFTFAPGLDETIAVPRLILGLRHGLYLANRHPGEFGRIRLRAAMARGAVAEGGSGFLGRAPIAATRLLDCSATRGALSGQPSADLAFIVDDELFQDIIRQDFPGLASDDFVRTVVQHREFDGVGWMYVVESGPVDPPPGSTAARVGAVLGGGGSVLALEELLSGGDSLEVSDIEIDHALEIDDDPFGYDQYEDEEEDMFADGFEVGDSGMLGDLDVPGLEWGGLL